MTGICMVDLNSAASLVLLFPPAARPAGSAGTQRRLDVLSLFNSLSLHR